jgi:hypothetical protein
MAKAGAAEGSFRLFAELADGLVSRVSISKELRP